VGIFRRVTRPVLEDQIHEQIREATAQLGEGTLENLLHGGDTWTVPGA
jgi:2-oxoglutarate ferredoxin oxidoreductase subunit beta